MFQFDLNGVYQWVVYESAKSQLAMVAQNENSLIALYLFGCLISRKLIFPLAAFLFCNFATTINFFNFLLNYQFYLLNAFIYSLLYNYMIKNNFKISQLCACVSLVLLDLGMSIDAIVNQSIESTLWSNYEYIALSFHVLFILSFIDIERIRATYNDALECILAKLLAL